MMFAPAYSPYESIEFLRKNWRLAKIESKGTNDNTSHCIMSEVSEAQVPFTDLHPRSHFYNYINDDKRTGSYEINIWILQLNKKKWYLNVKTPHYM